MLDKNLFHIYFILKFIMFSLKHALNASLRSEKNVLV